MKRAITLLTLLLVICSSAHAATDSTKIVWAFPITSYMMPAKKHVEIVQVMLPAGVKFEQGKQLGLLRGVAAGDNIDTSAKGYGKCHLIKGEYNYFTIHMDTTVPKPKAGDLIYTFIPKKNIAEPFGVFHCAAHHITFTTVTDTPFYKPADFLKKRTARQDAALMQKMLADIHYTAGLFATADTSKNMEVPGGTYKGKRVLDVMKLARELDLAAFLQFVAARPRRYAGNTWKLSETFATWVLNGGPVVVAGE